MIKMARLKVTIPILQEINRLYDKGYNMATIGKMLNLGHNTICKYVWKPRPKGSKSLKAN